MIPRHSNHCLERRYAIEPNAEISINDVIERDFEDKSYLSELEEQDELQNEFQKYFVPAQETSRNYKNTKKAKNLAWCNFIEKKKISDPQYVDTRRARERERLRKKRESKRRKQKQRSVEDVSKGDWVTSIHSLTHRGQLPGVDSSSQVRKLDIQEQLCVTEERIGHFKRLVWENVKTIQDDNMTSSVSSSSTLENVREAVVILESAERNVHWLSKQLEDFTAAVDNLSQVVETACDKVESSLLLHHTQNRHLHHLLS
ncbi:uncharacterized protein Gasu_45370 [Galdieria sulphuraria]|uniref:Uncharacterized protein n=1 Tax=Galdieria sulphuraria TaxID=130081 RepID=M2XD48_GALSU|nr:uncharacterized protein Gasu_45370 [Galdieria sulphuraria]EME27872.1 hypothetical protein Gasu_45370 [Galdieria sulphuraria]|eukprot:XP_005704392.1 hypothetical protein Gasu_45370 [Galdieria sulphuraria]